MKLSEGVVGQEYFVKSIELELAVKRRLEILGMTHSARVLVLNSKKSGTKIIKVRGTRFALGAEFSKGIGIEPVNTKER